MVKQRSNIKEDEEKLLWTDLRIIKQCQQNPTTCKLPYLQDSGGQATNIFPECIKIGVLKKPPIQKCSELLKPVWQQTCAHMWKFQSCTIQPRNISAILQDTQYNFVILQNDENSEEIKMKKVFQLLTCTLQQTEDSPALTSSILLG